MATQEKLIFAGPAGQLEGMLHLPDTCAEPGRSAQPVGIAVVAHPLPTMGGTMDNKVVTTLTRTFVEHGYATLRFNFRGVGASAGSYDEGNGETLDAVAAVDYMRGRFPGLPLLQAGFSFGAYVQARAAEQLQPQHLVLAAPAVGRFAMPHVPAHTLVVHGDLDEVVALSELLNWARPQHLAITVLAGAEHYFHGRLIQLKHVVTQHLKETA